MEIVNIEGTGGMTRSGRVFTLKFTAKSVSPTITLIKEKNMLTKPLQEKEASTATPTNTVAMTPLQEKNILTTHLQEKNVSP